MVREPEDRSGHFFHNKEGVIQGDSFSIIKYGIGVLPIIQEIQDVHPRATQPWYADEAGAGGKFA